MKIVRNGLGTMTGPAEWFAGTSTSTSSARLRRPRGSWAESSASRPERVEEVKPGDSVHIEPGENHWHGATPACFTTQIAYQGADDSGTHTVWGRRVTEEEYPG
ncbi:(R)-mandelonitrile lyase [Streptomyces sp. NPDC001414]